jgi:Domain of unknown function (DUF4279)
MNRQDGPVEDEYLAENPLVQETHASFAIYGDKLEPDVVSERLALNPDIARSKGDSIASKSGPVKQRTGVWLLESGSRIESTSLQRHVEFLLSEIEPRHGELLRICDEYMAEAVIICYWVPASFHGGPMLSVSLLKWIAAVGAALWFDVYPDLRDGTENEPSGG